MARQLVNEAIVASEVNLLAERGAALGIVSRDEAIALARSRGCDLVQDSVFSSPPTCRLSEKGAAGTQAVREARMAEGGAPKEIRIGTSMGAHDVETRRRQAAGLLAKGFRVKLSARLAKAERAKPVAARALLERLAGELAAEGVIERKPFGESGALSLILAPRDD